MSSMFLVGIHSLMIQKEPRLYFEGLTYHFSLQPKHNMIIKTTHISSEYSGLLPVT